MILKMLLALLVTQLLTVSFSGAHSLRTKLIFAKEGEMVALNCPQYKEGHSQVVWTSHTGQLMNLTDTVSAPAGQSHREVLITGGSLIILRASVIHQGNYSCSLGNASRKTWFRLTVSTTGFKENKGRGEYPATCYSQESCTLYCPEVNVPRVNSSILSSAGITWHKKGQKSPAESRFMNVEEKDSGVYFCVRSYLHSGKIYNTTYTVILDVKPKIQTGQSVISSPKQNDVFFVDLGSTVVIGCKAVLYSSFDDVFWQSGASPIGTDNRLPVYYNYSRIKHDDKTEMTASLVFKKVSKEDLAKNYTCKLESHHQLPTFITITLTQRGVCPSNVEAGEIVVLRCSQRLHNGTLWRMDTNQGRYVFNRTSEAEQKKMGVLLHGSCLVIPRASVDHQGNYTCDGLSKADSKTWILSVYTAQSKDMFTYPHNCTIQHSCQLHCPEVNIPDKDTPNITEKRFTWTKDGKPSQSYFESCEEKNSGVYTCTRQFLYNGQIYNRTFRVPLEVKPEDPSTFSTIGSPKDGEVFQVEVGKTAVIDCDITTKSCPESPFWLIGNSPVKTDVSNRVFYNFTCNKDTGKARASLVFREVLEEHLSKNFTCKFQSFDQPPSFVTVFLTRKALRSYISLLKCTVSIVVVMAVTATIYVKFKMDISLFFRDSLGCQRYTSDGKSYDAYLMCYPSDAHDRLNKDEIEWLENTLEDRFGYRLCLYDRDVLPGDAASEAVLDCVGRSRAVVLVPGSHVPELGSGLLIAIHAALVEKQTRLVFVKTEQTEASGPGSLAEALQVLREAGQCVTWKGKKSSSTFWKQLRYNLPAPQPAHHMHC
ncbi:interleukin-1 receptor-like 1 [Menidia menidia]